MKKDNFKLDLFVTLVGQCVVVLVSFALNKILSNFLSVENYGIYNIVRRTSSVISYLMIMALGIAIPKYLSMSMEDVDKSKYNKYVLASIEIMFIAILVIGMVIFILRDSFMTIIFGEEGYILYAVPIILYAVGTTISTYIYSYFRGNGCFYKYNFAQIFTQLLTLMIAWQWKEDVYRILMIWGISLIVIFGSRTLVIAISKVKEIILSGDTAWPRNEISELLSFCIPRVPGEFVLFSYTVVPTIIVSSKLGIESSAYYSVGFTINTTITSLFSMVGVILLPLVSRSIANKTFASANNKIDLLERIYFGLSLFFMAGIWIFTSVVIRLLFSENYVYSIPLVRIMSVAILPQAFYLLLRNPLDAISNIPYNSINLAISFIILIVLTWFSKDLFQAVGAVVLSYWILGVLTVISWKKCKKLINKEEIDESN